MDDALHIWTVYDHPDDMPDRYVVRRFEIREGRTVATDEAYMSVHLYPLREALARLGLRCMPRSDADEPHIIETWI